MKEIIDQLTSLDRFELSRILGFKVDPFIFRQFSKSLSKDSLAAIKDKYSFY